MTFNEFITKVYKHPYRSKAKTAEYIQDLIESGKQPTADDLAAIYRYMMPARASKLRKNHTPYEWVAIAAANDKDKRKYLQWVYADGNRIMASDGHRLHILPDDRTPGYYCPRTQAKVHDSDWYPYPDVDLIVSLPTSGNYSTTQNPAAEVVAGSPKQTTTIVQLTGTEYTLQDRYFDEATQLTENFTAYIPDDVTTPMKIIHDTPQAIAVIMPTRTKR